MDRQYTPSYFDQDMSNCAISVKILVFSYVEASYWLKHQVNQVYEVYQKTSNLKIKER